MKPLTSVASVSIMGLATIQAKYSTHQAINSPSNYKVRHNSIQLHILLIYIILSDQLVMRFLISLFISICNRVTCLATRVYLFCLQSRGEATLRASWARARRRTRRFSSRTRLQTDLASRNQCDVCVSKGPNNTPTPRCVSLFLCQICFFFQAFRCVSRFPVFLDLVFSVVFISLTKTVDFAGVLLFWLLVSSRF